MAAPNDHPPRHPVSATVDALGTRLAKVAEVPVWSMSAGEAAATLTALTGVTAQVAALEARVAGHARSVEVESAAGATSTANWWAHATKQTRAATHRKLWLAAGLESHSRAREALTAGQVVVEQAEAIVRALEALPDDLDAGIRDQAEERLVELAADYDAKQLKVLGRRILDVVAPEVGEAHEAKLLEREERTAAAKTRLTMHDDGHGTTHGRFTLPTVQAEMFRKALLAHAAPKHRAAVHGTLGERGERRPSPERLGQAFVEIRPSATTFSCRHGRCPCSRPTQRWLRHRLADGFGAWSTARPRRPELPRSARSCRWAGTRPSSGMLGHRRWIAVTSRQDHAPAASRAFRTRSRRRWAPDPLRGPGGSRRWRAGPCCG
ncbi:MAG: DUF222 domain-containing protein [Nocardioides sp.]